MTTARTLWVPAVNNHGGFGRWAFVEVTDPWDAESLIRAFVQEPVELGCAGIQAHSAAVDCPHPNPSPTAV